MEDLNLPNIDWENNCSYIISVLFVISILLLILCRGYFCFQGEQYPGNFLHKYTVVILLLIAIVISDHEATYAELSLVLNQHQPFKGKTFLWYKADVASIKEIIKRLKIFLLERLSLSTVNILWEEHKLMCLDCLYHVFLQGLTLKTTLD